MAELNDMDTRASPIRRGLSFSTIVMSGHLFDTKFFNECISILSMNSIHFRVIEWEIGSDAKQTSSVTLQLLARDTVSLDKALDQIEKETTQNNIEINEGSGPAFEKDLLKLIH